MKTTLKYSLIIGLLMFSNLKSYSQKDKISEDVSKLISKKREFNKENGFTYKIQLYYGKEKQAKKIQANFKKIYYWVPLKLVVELPFWKVHIGKYQTKLEADKALNKYRKKYKSAIIIKHKVK